MAGPSKRLHRSSGALRGIRVVQIETIGPPEHIVNRVGSDAQPPERASHLSWRRRMVIMLKVAVTIGALSALLFSGCATVGSGDGAAAVGLRNGGGAAEVGVQNDAPWKATGFRQASSWTDTQGTGDL